MKIKEALKEARSALASKGIPEANLEGEVLLRHALAPSAGSGQALSRAQLYASLEEECGEATEFLDSLIERRLAREPLAYILGQREFFGITLHVDRRVMIPRQETELLVEKALELAREDLKHNLLIADVGTGSGCIAIALALHLPKATIYATDVSPEALQVAALNDKRHGQEDRICLLQGDLLEPLPQPMDIVVANLPYIPSRYLPSLATEVLQEPRIALDGGSKGLDIITSLLRQVPQRTNPHAAIILEVDPIHSDAIVDLAEETFPQARLSVEKDMEGLDRAVVIRR